MFTWQLTAFRTFYLDLYNDPVRQRWSSHFAEVTKVQKGEVSCLRAWIWEMAEPRLKPRCVLTRSLLPSSRTSRDEATERPGRWQEQGSPSTSELRGAISSILGCQRSPCWAAGYLICPWMGLELKQAEKTVERFLSREDSWAQL